MTETLTKLGTGTFARGVHPPERKELAEHAEIEIVQTPAEVRIPLVQHIGAPCKSIVKLKQEVVMGELIGQSDAFVSAPIHASINGVVGKELMVTLPNGRHIQSIPIKASGAQLEGKALWNEIFGGTWDVKDVEKVKADQIQNAVRSAGIVGLGGAAFPTHVKLAKNDAKPIDTLLVNGCECEPYLTADYRLMLEAPLPVVIGAMLAAKAVGAKNVAIGIEDNKPKAIEVIRKACEGTNVKVMKLKTKYPQGGERSLLPAMVGRVMPTGGLPLDVGVVVINVGSATCIARAVLRGKPLTHRIMTVTGGGIEKPKNLLVPIGISYAELIEFCGGLKPNAMRAISGGPMMGFALGTLESPVTKGTSGLTILTDDEIRKAEETNCVRCGRCVDVCPLGLVPTKIALAARHREWETARKYHIQACVECGCCAYTCPASLPLVQLIRMGKATMPKN